MVAFVRQFRPATLSPKALLWRRLHSHWSSHSQTERTNLIMKKNAFFVALLASSIFPAALAASPTAKADPPPIASKWNYETVADKMSGKVAQYATVDAQESLRFKFPYTGTNMPTLMLRKHPKYGTDVLLQVDKGQFLCGVSSCSVLVKIDNNPPVRYTANGSGDHDPKVLFISPSQKLIAAIKNSKEVNIQATFYHEGEPIMTFPTAGLVWK
jgi:hypothetical protein